MEKNVKVCVTGGAGYLASFLIKQLLERGYIVHATLRSLGDASKVGLLKSLAHAETRLKLFEADIYSPDDFESAIKGCEIVVHMATPFQHSANANSQYKDTVEAAVGGVKVIMESCLRSNTVKRVIYTGSVVAASPLKDDGSGYKDSMDETCWTPLNLSYDFFHGYVPSKTLAEKEILSYNGKGLQVVSLACGVVGGDTIQSKMPETMAFLISQATNDEFMYKALRFLEDLLGKVPIAHVEDITEAHIFSMENEHVSGRFLCAGAFLKTAEIASLSRKLQQDISIPTEFIEDTKRETRWDSRKLEDLGFHYKCDAEKIINDSILCAKMLGNII
ncbi:Flavonol reductase/cinnamoyl-CoA reductase [Handroanthus impetiginosus]|uniref:Flavonol reductase/cinnamoyl-CoA reductase n=1 Tax=Handroanthus impetiginosus TaxID=429701 RepID=A0A2G9I9X2_9LAMI|nr:Flavonol reductase/cinnamoyl-CoA reductase [Handroanthus impetiginosus]